MFKSGWISQVLQLPGSSNEEFDSFITDSRAPLHGCVFVAIRGDRFDGHDFIDEAVKKGARGILYQEDFKLSQEAKALCNWGVPDVTSALRKLAKAWRERFKIPVIGIAGSVGKTTTKEFVSAMLTGKFGRQDVLKTEGSQNGFLGIPMTLLKLRPHHKAAVIEIGIDEPGAMAQHIEVVAPTIATVTTIAAEHLHQMKSMETIAHEECLALTLTAQKGGVAVVNQDDPWILPMYDRLPKNQRVGFSLNSPTSLKSPLPGKHNLLNLTGAAAVAQVAGLTFHEMNQGLQNFEGATGRSQVEKTQNGVTVIKDFYNANPASMVAAFELLIELSKPQSATAWAVLGDMLELGPDEKKFHSQLAESILKLGIRNLVLYGPLMSELFRTLESQKNRFQTLMHFSSHEEIAQYLNDKLQSNSVLLLKGSRGKRMEKVWTVLEALDSQYKSGH